LGLVGDVTDIETIVAGRGILDLPRLRRRMDKGYWRKMKAARVSCDLFSADRFVAIEVPSAVRASRLKASRA
jgi:hypothetical protein